MASKPDFIFRPKFPLPVANDEAIRCVVMRGGTSRGLFFHEQDLPADPTQRDRVIMGAVGAPDPRHVDGLGGGDMLLSKVAIVARSERADADIECEFANLTPGKDRPTWGTNCGNLVAAVALFAVEEGLVIGEGDAPVVRIRNRNSDSLIEARFGALDRERRKAYRLAGMPETGTSVDLDFVSPAGSVQSQLLPTGNAREMIQFGDRRSVDISIVDAGALYVFVKAGDLGLTGTETSEQLQNEPGAFDLLEHLRAEAAKMIGLVEFAADAALVTPDVPKLAFVGSAAGYSCDASSATVDADLIDVVSRIISSQKYHKAYAVTGAIATAAAAAIEGSVVHEAIGKSTSNGLQEVRIGHPNGVLACEVESSTSAGTHDIAFARIKRTARRVSQGTVFVPSLS